MKHIELLNNLVCPKSREKLELKILEEFNDDMGIQYIKSGILCSPKGYTYPIINQIPRIYDGAWFFYKDKMRDFKTHLQEFDINLELNKPSISFSENIFPTLRRFQKEWEKHSVSDKTWGWSQNNRISKFREYMQLFEDEYRDKLFLDLGAGTGQLTATLARELKGTFVGVDLSPGIEKGIHLIKDQNLECFYIQADLMNLPFEYEMFDYIHASGVLHHTPDTKKAFNETSKFTKKEGKLGVWLYRKNEDILLPLIPFVNHRWFVLKGSRLRKFTTKMNPALLYKLIYIYSAFFHFFYKLNSWIRKREHNQKIKERVTSIFDALAPPFAYKQSVEEVKQWYYDNNYQDLVLTDQDNKSGFNIVGIKT